MLSDWRLPVIGVIASIAITTAMDASGVSAFSALPLFPLMLLSWYLDGCSRAQIGFLRGRLGDYRLAVLHSVLVLGLLALAAWAAGSVDLDRTKWRSAAINFAIMSISTVLVAMITEEGFFRGWLWRSLEKRGLREESILVLTSLAFTAWHLSAVLLETGFNPPLRQVPVFLANAFALGVIWGTLRLQSRSIVVSSVAHGLWNGGAYILFGFGTKTGALGIQNTALYGPEVGVLGLVANVAFAIALWRGTRGERAADGERGKEKTLDAPGGPAATS